MWYSLEIKNGREFVLGTMQSILLHKEVTDTFSLTGVNNAGCDAR